METKISNKIKAYILKMGEKMTNEQMATKLGVPRMSFAGVLAAMKRNGEIKNNFLKSDLKKTASKKVAKTASKKVTKTTSKKVSKTTSKKSR